ncbi:MAG: extracellular matrix/biofilm biosynthesis regulator RemA family protein, partial [Christensenellales bacterium]
ETGKEINDTKFVSIGFGNLVNRDRVIAVVNPDTLPSKRLMNDARDANKLLDATCGRKTRAIIVVDSGQIILCGLHTDTIAGRLNLDANGKTDEEDI